MITKVQLALLEDTCKILRNIFSKDDNIHKYTKSLGKYCTDVFLKIDDTVKLSTFNKSFDATKNEILQASESSQKATVAVVLNSISTSPQVETETKLNVQRLLVRTWSLANTPGAPDNAKGLIVDNLFANYRDGGGCYAGISARLIQPYSELLLWIAKDRLQIQEMLLQYPHSANKKPALR